MLRWPEQGNGQASSSLLPPGEAAEIQIRDLCLSYGGKPALQHISMDIARCQVTAFIGPSGCGKSTLIRCLNRLNDLVDGVAITGSITIAGQEILDPSLDVTELLSKVNVPTLVMHKRDDQVQPFEAGRELAAGIRGARFLALPGQNHFPLAQDPETARMIEEIRLFLKPR